MRNVVIMLEIAMPDTVDTAEAERLLSTIRQDAEHYALCALASAAMHGAQAGAATVHPGGNVERAALIGWEEKYARIFSVDALDAVPGNAKMSA